MNMKNISLFTLFTITISFVGSGCQSSSETLQSNAEEDTLFQYSVLSTLLQGVYDGQMSCGELKQNGNFGLGTFNALDGEMVVLDSQVYQVTSDGVARMVSDDV